jgi:hypothetical protein
MHRDFKKISVIGLIAATLVGCASTPVGPSLVIMPAPGKPFEIFQK